MQIEEYAFAGEVGWGPSVEEFSVSYALFRLSRKIEDIELTISKLKNESTSFKTIIAGLNDKMHKKET